ncbi:leucine-rich repeat-containing protein 37A2-like [Octodon degus]|uniref:Leucine-rich repeat-containing protein 37A2-like n=1 Tax=Octodon degus TaxID=10160 RepID=A0A6P6DG64_OCTDE|nr:leucine-rich repeat-containing protein 37A2-like [Octodon degus]
MFLRLPWAPGLLTWQQLWLLVLVAPLPERHWILPTTKPQEPREPWALPDLLPELSNALTVHPQQKGFGKVASSAPSQGVAPLLESPGRIGLSQVQLETQTQNRETVKAHPSSSHQEAKDDLLQPSEEAELSLTQQDTHAQYELGPEEVISQLLTHQEEKAPSPSSSKVHHSNMQFVTVKPVDMEVTKTTEAEKELQPTSSQKQAPAQPPESSEKMDLSSSQQKVPPQNPELSEEVETSSTAQEPAAHPVGPLVGPKSSATRKIKPGQPFESPRTEEPSGSQLEATVQPSKYPEELETSLTQLERLLKFKEHHEEKVSTSGYHHGRQPHLPHVTGKPPNLQLAITPELTKEEGIFPTHPETTTQSLGLVTDVEPSVSHQEVSDLFSEPSEGAELLPFQQESPAQASEPAQQEATVGGLQTSEEGEPSLIPQEPPLTPAQPSELANELEAQPPELHEAAASPVGDDQAHPPTFNSVAVTPPELSNEVEVESSIEQESLAESSVSPEQFEPLRDTQELITQLPNPAIRDENSPFDSGVPTPAAELPVGHSLSQPESSPLSPDSSADVAVSPIQEELSDQPSRPPMKFTLSFLMKEGVTFSIQPSEPSEDREPSSVPHEGATPPSELPDDIEPFGAQGMTPSQPAELSEAEEPAPAQQPAMAPPLMPSEEVELSPAQPIMLSQPPNESTVHPPPHYKTTVPTPAQGQAQHPIITFNPSDLEITLLAEPMAEDKPSTVPKKPTVLPPKHHVVTHPPPTQIQTQRPKLSLLTVQPLHQKLIKTPQASAVLRPSPTGQVTPPQPPEPPKEAVTQAPMPHNVKVVTLAQQPTSPRVTDQPLHLEHTTPAISTEAQYSVALQEAESPPIPPEVTLVPLEQTQAQQPTLAEVSVQPMDVELTITEYSVDYSPTQAFTGQEKQNTRTDTGLCELCTCQSDTLSCTGLSPKWKLHQVPVLEPNTTFTTINFQENSIFYLAENIWTTYKWAEKLNLSENDLTELHKNSFKGLLSLQYLDLSCNKIQFIEAQTFEPLPFLQFINLRCNLLTQLSFGTFRAWHGMQFLQKVILNHNPLATVEDSYLYKLPALRYLDLGTTHTPLPVVENILMMTLGLKTLVVPRHMACCLCQFKSDIEVVCKTVKLHCDDTCVTNTTQCLEEAPIGNTEGAFMKVLQARKKNTKTELVIEPEKSAEESAVNWLDLQNEELDSSDENEVIGALNYLLPYFSEENLEDIHSLLPFIRLLFSNMQHEANPHSDSKGNVQRRPSHQQPVSTSSAYGNELKKLYFLRNWLNAEIQGKIEEVKKKEKIGKIMQSRVSSSKFQIIPRNLAGAQAQENRLAEDGHRRRRLRTMDQVLKGPERLQKRLFKEWQKRVREKQSTLPLVEHTADMWSLGSHSPGKPGQNDKALRPRNSVRKLFSTQEKEPVSPSLKGPLLGKSAISIPGNALWEVKNRGKDFTSSILLLEHARAKVKSMKAKPIFTFQKSPSFPKTHSLVAPRTPQPKPREQLTKETMRQRLRSAERPLFWALRSLIHSPQRGLPWSSGELHIQESALSQLNAPAEPSEGSTAAAAAAATENQSAGNTSEGNVFTTDSPISATVAALSLTPPKVTAPDLMSTKDHANDTHWEYPSINTDSPPNSPSFPLLPSPGDQFESQLNQQLHVLIPNKEVRRLISYVIRTLKMDCSDPRVQLACAKLISRTGLLMKLLSEQQEEKVAQTQWDTEQWKSDTYINESTGAASGQQEQGASKFGGRSEGAPDHGFSNKLILAISMTVVVMLLIVIFCLIEICSHRTALEEGGSSRGFFHQRRKCSAEENPEGFSWFWRPLWLRDMNRPLSVTRQQSMAQKLHDKDSSDEDATTRDTGELSEGLAEEGFTEVPTGGDEEAGEAPEAPEASEAPEAADE